MDVRQRPVGVREGRAGNAAAGSSSLNRLHVTGRYKGVTVRDGSPRRDRLGADWTRMDQSFSPARMLLEELLNVTGDFLDALSQPLLLAASMLIVLLVCARFALGA
jgi:hypothetical protein